MAAGNNDGIDFRFILKEDGAKLTGASEVAENVEKGRSLGVGTRLMLKLSGCPILIEATLLCRNRVERLDFDVRRDPISLSFISVARV